MRCAHYLRLSQDRDGDELGITRYRADGLALAAQLGVTSTVEYVDNDTSASTGKPRPAYEEMLASVERGEVDLIIAWHLDRLLRRPVELERLIELCERHNVTIRLCRVGEIDPSTPSGRLIARQFGAYARFEVEQKADRQKRANLQHAQMGRPPSGRRLFGYRGTEVVPGEAEAVQDAYRWFAGGVSLTRIADRLNEAGWKTTVGGQWGVVAVRAMLRNPRYCGQRWYLGERIGEGAWPALVDETVWEATRTVLSDPGRHPGGGNRLRWLGAGLYLCDRCEVPVKNTYRGIKARGTLARIYKCPQCSMTRVAEPVDDYVTAVTMARLRDPRIAERLSKNTPDAAALRLEAKALRTRQREAKQLFDEGELTAAEFRESRAKIAEKLADVEARSAAAGRGSALAEMLRADDPGEAWLLSEVRGQQEVLREVITVRLVRVGPGRRPFDPETVKIG